MTTATLTFNLPDEQVEFDMACHATEAYVALQSVGQTIRNQLKYGSLADDRKALEQIQQEIAAATNYIEG